MKTSNNTPRDANSRATATATPRRSRHWAMLTALPLALAPLLAGACDDYNSCEDTLSCPHSGTGVDGGGATGGSGNVGGSAGNATGTGGVSGGVSGGPDTGPAELSEEDGVFVDPSASGDGTRATPFATLAEALTSVSAGGANADKDIYACSTHQDFNEAITFGVAADSVRLLGGLDCDNWEPSGNAPLTELTSTTSNGIELVNVTSLIIENFSIVAQDALDTGTSSYGVWSTGSTATIRGCTITAGNGADGGTPEQLSAATQGIDGNPGDDACTLGSSGGALAISECGAVDSVGNSGGAGGGAVGVPGGSGQDGTPIEMSRGGGGDAQTDSATCTLGDLGEAGTAGTTGSGASNGSFFDGSGYLGVEGGTGTAGTVGQGGGGGGGSLSPVSCPSDDPNPPTGASGGSGGGGGCGGSGGQGGTPGGASIALGAAMNSDITLEETTLVTGSGGVGGDGSLGQAGGAGGAEGASGTGNNSSSGCAGGLGGNGGNGGLGGGGAGGAAIGIATAVSSEVVQGENVTFNISDNTAAVGGNQGIDGTGALGGSHGTKTY